MRSFKQLILFCCLFACSNVLLSGCGGGEPKFKATTTLDAFQKSYTTQKEKEALNKINLAPLLIENMEEAGEYLLGAGDLLAIKVFESERLDTEVRVSSRGIINVPLIGDVNVMNLTAAEVEQQVEDLYKKDYLQ